MHMLPDGLIVGFERHRLPGDGVEIDALVAGKGPPLLLLHGYPQTRVMWRAVAGELAKRYTVVIPDLRGYGRSDKPRGDAAHERYSKRTLARDQAATMCALGFERFAVVGHDRGGRVGYRLAADAPELVTALCVLDILPTLDVWEAMDAGRAIGMFHWSFLAQPAPFPEKLIAADPGYFQSTLMRKWAGKDFVFAAENLADYAACFADPDSIHATCEDYRAGWVVDRLLDSQDRATSPVKAPVLCLWSDGFALDALDPLRIWRRWAAHVEGHAVACGHFIAEEQPDALLTSLIPFLARHAKSGA
jgi:haloacetate dehalogenase